LDLLEEFGSIAEFGDMMVDLEYGGKDVKLLSLYHLE
jgi:hypothetical protein